MIRTGTSFLSNVRASISPEGPAPTYAIKHRKLLAIDQKMSRTIKTWGGVAREDAGMIKDILDLKDDASRFWDLNPLYICNTKTLSVPCHTSSGVGTCRAVHAIVTAEILPV